MAFGQASGPPAGQRQLEELELLLSQSGYDSFREARHPFGLSQRQANGRFTIDEADALRERLVAMAEVTSSGAAPVPEESNLTTGATVPTSAAAKTKAEQRRRERDDQAVASMDAEVLADELARRGWCCIPPG